MRLRIDLPGTIFDRLVALAINDYRTVTQHAAYVLEKYVREQETPQAAAVDPGAGETRERT
jgi:hypothetical protein